MKHRLIMALCLMLSVTSLAFAAEKAPVVNFLPLADGIVKKIDTQTGKITLAHGEIPNLGMKPMTMPYLMQNPALLKTVHEGDKVKFSADKVKGIYTVTHLVVIK